MPLLLEKLDSSLKVAQEDALAALAACAASWGPEALSPHLAAVSCAHGWMHVPCGRKSRIVGWAGKGWGEF